MVTTILSIYQVIGFMVTLYTILFFFVTGLTIFEDANTVQMPFRQKVSYVLVMFFLFPIFYFAFLKELFSLRKMHKERAA